MPRHPHSAIRVPVGSIALALAVAFATAIAPPAQAQINVLHSFYEGGDGGTPIAGVTLDRAGNLYGTTAGTDGGMASTVYKLTHGGGGWILNTLYTFNHPNDPALVYAGVVVGPDGLLYGTSYSGGQFNLGTVFSLRPPATACRNVSCTWSSTTIHNFDGLDGTHPDNGNLVFDAAGNLYGTTSAGGGHVRGTVFKLTRSGSSWTESVLYSFTGGGDGGTPENGVAFDSAGNLYGTTNIGGANGYGTVFELSPACSGWTENTLYSFTDSSDGANPIGGVAVDAQGNLYGTTSVSLGGFAAGTVFELSPSSGGWAFTVLHSFSQGTYPGPVATPTLDAAGNIYGTSRSGGEGFGLVFHLTPTSGGYSYTSYEFDQTNGDLPSSGVTVDANGNLYGTTALGGAGPDGGVVWEITP